MEITKEAGPSRAEKTIPLVKKEYEPIVARVSAPPPPVVHQERTLTHTMLVKTMEASRTKPTVPVGMRAEDSAKPIGMEPARSVNGGDPIRPFTLKNLEAPRKFPAREHPGDYLVDGDVFLDPLIQDSKE